MNEVFVLGYFGYKTNQLDGQTVKTRDLYRLVKEQVNGEVDYYDTQEFLYCKSSLLRMFWKAARCRTLIYLPAHNNLRTIFPILFCLSVFFQFKIHYFVVGGWLREFLTHLPIHRYMLKRIAGIHVETQRLKQELEQYYQFGHVNVFPNFRFFDFNPQRDTTSEKLRLVFMARVNKMKGLDWIFCLAAYIVEHHLQDRFSLTFFGPFFEEEDKAFFEKELAKYPFAIYKGVLQPAEIYETLSQHDVMLLPTHYYTRVTRLRGGCIYFWYPCNSN